MLSNTNNWRILTNENEVTMVSDPENKPGCVVICLLSLSYPYFGWPSEHRRKWIWISGNLFTENTVIIEDFIYCTFLLEWDLSSQVTMSLWIKIWRHYDLPSSLDIYLNLVDFAFFLSQNKPLFSFNTVHWNKVQTASFKRPIPAGTNYVSYFTGTKFRK